MEKLLPKIKRYKKKFEYSYAFGVYPTLELLKYRRKEVLKVIVKNKKSLENAGVQEILTLSKKENILVEFSEKQIGRIAHKENTLVVGVFRKYQDSLNLKKNHIVLVNPRNLGNLGTVIRSMLAFNFSELVIIGQSADHFDPRVVRATMGAIFNISITHFSTFKKYSEKLKQRKLFLFMLDAKATKLTDLYLGEKRKENMSLVFGNEGAGLSEDIIREIPSNNELQVQKVYIPQSDMVDSLNLAVSASIAMFYLSDIW